MTTIRRINETCNTCGKKANIKCYINAEEPYNGILLSNSKPICNKCANKDDLFVGELCFYKAK